MASSSDLAKEAEAAGFSRDRQKGSHVVYTKAGTARPIVIPVGRKDLSKHIVSIIRKQIRDAVRTPA